MKSNIRDHALEHVDDETAKALEDPLWWNTGRKSIIRSFLKAEGKPARKIMDIGCGSGINFDVLSEFGTVVGIDRSSRLAKRARDRGIAEHVYEEDVFNLKDMGEVDLFTLFDVLEHMEDDSGFLTKLGKSSNHHSLLISVPACPFLFSEHDRLLHHQRRYSRAMLEEVLSKNGYQIIKMSYFMFLLFPFILLARGEEKIAAMLGRRKTTVRLGVVPGWLNSILTKVLQLETIISGPFSFPFGLWLFVLARHEGSTEN